MKRYISLCLLWLCQLAFLAQAGWAQDAPTTYTLTKMVSPALSGSISPSGTQQLEAGATVYMRTYNSTDYVFQHWAVGDSVVSETANFTFTMPARDCTLTAVYKYAPGNPANPSLPETTYWLTLRTNPQNAGSFNRNSGNYTAGQSFSIRAYNNTDYVFSHWISADTIVSESASFNYTMPAHDAELTAVFNYQPGSPANPDTAQIYYTVALSTKPANAGSFSWNSTTQAVARSSCYIYAYENTDFTFREWQQDGKTVSTDRQYRFQMPAENISLVAVYDYTPSNPGNPGKNYWNEETGEVIVDDFTPGSLSSAVSNTIGGSGNRDKVQMITVAGPINQYDWGVVNNYPNCTFLDMSRTYGMTYVPSYNFSGNEMLTTIILPAGIEKIDYYAFRNCSSLSSISVYAATPPVLGNRAFEGIADSIVYVPADAISLYQEAEGWKDFTILPLAREVSALEVNLPEGTDVNLYKDMFVELINTKSGQKQRYVVTNRLTYTFNSLVHRTSYNVYLRNQRDDVLAEVDSVDIVDRDVSITFPELMVPRNLTLSVLTPKGEDVTSEVAVTWFDQKDSYLTRGHVLTSQLEGQQAKFRVQLPQALAMQYLVPADSLYEVQAENSISITLDTIPQTTISGTVRDIKTRQPLSGATIAVSQLLNGLYSKAFTTKTDKLGQWSLTVFEAPTDVTASMDEYVSKTQSLSTESLSNLESGISFELKDISGTTIALDLTYTDNTGETVGFYSDYANVAYEVYNVTTDKRVDSLSVQYPQIVLMEQLPEGTVLRVTATSKNQKFMPVEATATVDSLDRASVTLPIVQLGAISASFSQTDNSAVVGILYDAQGRLVKKYSYGSATLSISELQDGDYTLVTMGSSQFFNSIGSVSQFAESGLAENTDYVKNAVTVKSGQVTTVSNQLVPLLDETKFYYTGDETAVSINKSQITAGNYLTITGRLDFKDSYAGGVSDVKLVFDLPEEASFVDNSVMRGANMASYTYADHRLIVPLDYFGERVRFCFIPTIGGDFNATASAQFTLGGKTITQPIGNVVYTVKDLSISVPSIVAKTIVPVSGNAPGKSQVEIYDNGTLMGQTTALANGLWITNFDLGSPYNLSAHSVTARITSPSGIVMHSETQSLTYNKMAIYPLSTEMSFFNGWLRRQVSVVFDFDAGKTSEMSYMFYTGTDITFITNLSNNDTSVVSNVTVNVYTDKNEIRRLPAVYDKKSDRWIAVSRFESNNLPVNVCVDFVVKDEVLYDKDELTQDIQNAKEAVDAALAEVDELCERLSYGNNVVEDSAFSELIALLDDSIAVRNDSIEIISSYLLDTYLPEVDYDDEDLTNVEDVTNEELEQFFAETDEDFMLWISELYLTNSSSLPLPNEDGSYIINSSDGVFTLSKRKLDTIDSSELETLGYKCVPLTGDNSVFYLCTDNGYSFVNTLDSVQYQLLQSDEEVYADARRRLPKIFEDLKGCVDGFKSTSDELKSLVNKIKSYSDVRDVLPMADNLIVILADLKDNLECLYDDGIDGLVRSASNFFGSKIEKAQKKVDAVQKSAAKSYKFYKEAMENSMFFYRMEKEQRAIAQSLYDAWAASTDVTEKARLLKEAGEASKKADGYLEGLNAAKKTARIYLEDWKDANKALQKATQKLENIKAIQKASMAVFDKIPKTLRAAKAYKTGKNFVSKIVKFIGSPLGTLLQAIPLYLEADEMITELGKWSELYHKVETILPCPGDSANAYRLYDEVKTSYGLHIIGYGSVVCADAVGMALDFATVSWIASLICDVYSITVGWYNSKTSDTDLKWYYDRYSMLNCTLPPDPPLPPLPPIDPIHDPSGYVYEGVSSNRVQGVTATAYYKETVEDMYGDLHENIVLWDAEEYAQENPLFTDEYGMYAWDVPQGLWQVKFEKEGYQTTYSEWLPVPPPQLDVNIPMTQLLQPTVKQGKAYGEGVEVEFDKYMDPELLTTDNILVTKNGTAISGTIRLLNEEEAYEGRTEKYASKVRFEVPEGEELLSTDEVQLTVRKAVKSYAGVQMQDDYTQKFDVEPRVRSIVTDSALLVKYGGEHTLTVAALPAEASKGKKLTVKSLSTMIATASVEDVTLDENGQATLTVTGELPGSTVLAFELEGSDVEATTIVNVRDASQMMASAPKASRVSGTEVYRGTKITLSSETRDAVIWYTLDGSCPCDEKTAIKYNPDEPIVIAEDNVTIKAMAVSDELSESDVVTFTYRLKQNTLGYQLDGWTWLSHNLESAVPVSEFTDNAERILSQTQELVRDSKYGLIGNLTELLPIEAYKLNLSAQTEKRLQGYAFNALDNTVPVEAGWNWIGYPVNQTMTLDEALAFFTPTEGDYIVGQDGYAEYADGEWNGTLEGMIPGKGYLFKSATKADIVFNTSIVSTANSRIGKRNLLMNSPWAYDRHAYSSIMPLTAELYKDGVKVADDDYLVGAFCGSECRGIGIWKNGRAMLSVYGEAGDELRFVAYNPETENVYDINQTLTMTADNTGTWHAPFTLTLGQQTTGIKQLYNELTTTPAVARDHITVSAGGRAISRLTLTDMGGRTVLTLNGLGMGATVTTASLPEGMYIVTVQAEGQTYYKKIVKAGR